MQEQEEEQVLAHEEIDANALVWNCPHYTLAGKPFIPVVFEGPLDDSLPSPFNTVTIYLDGRLQADLTWKKAKEQAQKAAELGYGILWDIDIGLFEQLPFALTNQTQYLSLTLSLEHFRDSLWKEFKSNTVGLSIYRGNADFSVGFRWDDAQVANLRQWLSNCFADEAQFASELQLKQSPFTQLEVTDLFQSDAGKQLVRLFCRDVALEYLLLLASRLPDTLPIYLFLNVSAFAPHPLWQAQLLHAERFEHLNLALNGTTLPIQAWGWQSSVHSLGYSGQEDPSNLSAPQEIKVGICLPSMLMCRPSQFTGLEEAFVKLLEEGIPFRIIAENHLITEWDGLDYLIYTPAGLSIQGKRKLQGFCAAGGTVVSVAQPLGLAYEETFAAFMQRMRE